MTRAVTVLALLAAAAPAARAQTLQYLPRTGGYAALAIGGGNFTFGCDSLCAERELGSSHMSLLLGRHFGRRMRIELGAHIQKNRDEASDMSYFSAGAAVYLTGNLHLRGAATFYRPSIQDTGGTFEGSGGPGFLVGGGYDVRLLGRLYVSPFVQYSSGSMSSAERTVPGGGAPLTTPADMHTMSFGVTLAIIPGNYRCTTASGERIWLSRGNRASFIQCLNAVEARIGRRTGFKR